MISTEERYPKKKTVVDGKTMAYVEVGSGDPILFLHGNPTSSYLWRNVIPHLEAQGRCIAPDLIGMGDSDKLAKSGMASYRFVEHRHYLDALLEQLSVKDNVTLVVHDWGSALGFDWARRHPGSVKAIAYMEAIVMPIAWDDFPEPVRPIFQAFRSPAGEDIVLQQNAFVEQVLSGAIMRKLTDAEMNVYRRPYQTAGESRRPTLTWPRELPIDDRPPDVVALVRGYGTFLSESSIPKLFINAEPGAILRGRAREYCRTWPEQTEITVKGIHFIQEDSPDEIGKGISEWLTALDDVGEA